MSRLMATVKGSPKDHTHISDQLSDDDATRQLAMAYEVIGKNGTLALPWLTVHGQNLLAVQLID